MTTLPNKKVSVVVPNYNYARYIKRRLESVVRQTYPIYELIVLDDASSDESVKLIRQKIAEVKRRYPKLRVRIVENEKNSGKTIAAWKKGIELAKGDYVWIAEADDLCSQGFLKEAMKGFEDPEVVLSYTESAIINGVGLMIAPNFRWSRDKEKTGHYARNYVRDGREEVEEIMAIRCTIPNVSAVVLKKDKRYLKYLDESLKFTQAGDWYFYAKVLENGKIAYNRKALNKFRIHGGSVTAGAKNVKRHLQEIEEMHEYFNKNYKLSSVVEERMEAEMERVKERLKNK